jgi:ankyrin repeat protein
MVVKFLCQHLRIYRYPLSRIGSGFSRLSGSSGSSDSKETQSRTFVFSYFFDERVEARRTFNYMLRCVLYQLLSMENDWFRFLYPNNNLFRRHDFRTDQMLTVVRAILKSKVTLKSGRNPTLILLIDAADECCKEDQDIFREFIEGLLNNPGLRILITGRKPLLAAQISEQVEFPIAKDSLRSFVSAELDELAHQKTLPEDVQLSIVDTLSEQDSFLSVQLLLRYLSRQKTISLSRSVLAAVKRRKDELTLEDAFWLFMESLPKGDEAFLLRCLYFVIEAKSPLSVLGLSFLMSPQDPHGNPHLQVILENTPLDFEEDMKAYKPLLQVREGSVALLHGSITEILNSPKALRKLRDSLEEEEEEDEQEQLRAEVYKEMLKDVPKLLRHESIPGMVPDLDKSGFASLEELSGPLMGVIHSIMAERCLVYLICSLEAGLADPLSFLRYSTVYWTTHLRRGLKYLQEQHFHLTDSLLNRAKSPKNAGSELFLTEIADTSGLVVAENPPKATIAEDVYSTWKGKLLAWDERKKIKEWPSGRGVNTISQLAALNLCDIFGAYVNLSALHENFDQNHPLYLAAANNATDSIIWMMDQIRTQTEKFTWVSDFSPISAAILFGQIDALVVILQALKRQNIHPRLSSTIILEASKRGFRDIFLFLWKPRNGDNAFIDTELWKDADTFVKTKTSNESIKDFLNALDSAIKLNLSEVVIQLLPLNRSISAKEINDRCLLHEAVAAENLDLISRFLKLGADKNLAHPMRGQPLHIAAELGTKKTLRLLLAADADVNARNRDGQTPLHTAASKGRADICIELCRGGADPFLEDGNGNQSLHLAAESGNEGLVSELLDLIAAEKQSTTINHFNTKGESPLHIAAGKGFERVVDVLLSFKAPADTFDEHGQTALFHAVRSGSLAVVASLIMHGASPCTNDFKDQTPLHLAATLTSDIVAMELCRFGADANARDTHGRTPLDCWGLPSSRKVIAVRKVLENCGGRYFKVGTNSKAQLETLKETGPSSDMNDSFDSVISLD